MRHAVILALAVSASCRAETTPVEAPDGGAAPVDAPIPAPSASVMAPPDSVVREERELEIAGKKERWRLEWKKPPEWDCFEPSCPCENVTYGERGDVTLVRARPGADEQRFDLGERALQRWPVFEDDSRRMHGTVETDLPLVKDRPVVTIIHLGDYDHDGLAAELVLDRGDSPCSMHSAVVVGVDSKHDRLHYLSVAGKPEAIIDLNGRAQWERIRRATAAELANGVELVQFGCGNHGSGQEVTYIVRLTGAGFDVKVRTYECDASFKRTDRYLTREYQAQEHGR